jgi:hypothetical protein
MHFALHIAIRAIECTQIEIECDRQVKQLEMIFGKVRRHAKINNVETTP